MRWFRRKKLRGAVYCGRCDGYGEVVFSYYGNNDIICPICNGDGFLSREVSEEYLKKKRKTDKRFLKYLRRKNG